MYNNNGYQQQQGGYPQGNYQDGPRGASDEYYSGGQHQQGHNQPPPQYQQHNSQYGQNQQHNSQYGGQHQPQNDSYNQPYGQRDDRSPGYGGNPNYDNQQSYGNQDNFNNGQESDRGVMGALAGAAAGGYGAYKLAGPATGHNKTSGLVGALGGALTGHVLQDGAEHWKDSHDEKKKKEKEEKKHKHDNEQHGGHHDRRDSNDRPRSGHFAGGFTNSSQDVRLDAHGEFNLHAQCRRMDGSLQSSTLSLNRILENDNGTFRWSNGHSSGGPSFATVESGDTLRAIAARHNCSYEELARHNGIQNPDMIYPGQRLEVPGGGHSSGGGNFGASARNVRLVDGGQTLEAELQRNGDWVTSSICLDERIGNKNGCLELV